MLQHFDLKTMESTLKSIDLAKYKYKQKYGNEYPIPMPDFLTSNVKDMRDYCCDIVRAIGISAEPIILNVNSVAEAQESYKCLVDRLFAFTDINALPSMPTTNIFDCFEVAKKLWYIASGYGFNVEVVCDERAPKLEVEESAPDFSLLGGHMFKEFILSKDKLANKPDKLFVTDVSYVYVLCKDLLHAYEMLCGEYPEKLKEDLPFGAPMGSPAVISSMECALSKFEEIAVKLINDLDVVNRD